ncbi:MAG: SRPBCC family protein [Actinomycetia bacterium]|nr:SRPBCC family protein [Actinomycetes bacterium]
MRTGTATIEINRSPQDVWAALTDVTRMGEWSPECTSARWVPDSTGPAKGAKFEGDNIARIAGKVVKKWTTTSEVTACEPNSRFEFCAAGYTNWSYVLEPAAGGTRVTESFSYEPQGFVGFIYEKVLSRPRMMTKGMERTLARVKATLEAK